MQNLNSTARPCDEGAFSPFHVLADWCWHLALAIYMFVVVNYHALAQATNFLIARRKLSSSGECRIGSWEVWDTKSSADCMCKCVASLSCIFTFSECKEGWFELRPYGCYTLKGEKKTWDQWKQECDKEDAVLATFETETEYNALEQYMESNKGQFYHFANVLAFDVFL